jgi:hypothetical protein
LTPTINFIKYYNLSGLTLKHPIDHHMKFVLLGKSRPFYFIITNDPLRSAESSRRLLLEQESESDPEPFSSLMEECET